MNPKNVRPKKKKHVRHLYDVGKCVECQNEGYNQACSDWKKFHKEECKRKMLSIDDIRQIVLDYGVCPDSDVVAFDLAKAIYTAQKKKFL